MMNTRGQSISEYGLVVIVVIVAFTAMNTFFKRGVQGVVKSTSDQLGACAEKEYNLMTGKTGNYHLLGEAEPGLIAGTGSMSPQVLTQGISSTATDTNGQLTRHVTSSFSTGVTVTGTYADQMSAMNGETGAVSQPGTPDIPSLNTRKPGGSR